MISIHAPTRGATNPLSVLCSLEIIFQSTLPREERPRAFILCSLSSVISIHAPTRGATLRITARHLTSRFQSTLPREERRCYNCQACNNYCYFNPRSHERSDGDGFILEQGYNISIHAPTRGATVHHPSPPPLI